MWIADSGSHRAWGIESEVRMENSEFMKKQLELSSSQLLATDYWIV